MLRRRPILIVAVFLAGARAHVLAAPPAFDPDAATPYFSDGAGAEARHAFAVEKWADAERLFSAYVDQHAKPADRHQAAFLAAFSASRAGRYAEAATRFDALVEPYPLLADHERLYAARAYLSERRYDLAIARAEKVSAASPLDGDARLVRADALLRAERWKEAETQYRAYLEKYPVSWREPEARLHLAQAIDAPALHSKAALVDDRWAEVRPLLLDLYLRFPTESQAREAASRLRAREPAALTLSSRDHLTRGLALFEAQRNAEAEAEVAAALAAGDLDEPQQCVARFSLAQCVFKERDRPRAAALFDAAIAACEKKGCDPELHVKALYQGARCHAARGEAAVAAADFARAEKEHPTSSYADDARLRQAEVWDAQADKARAQRRALDAGTPEDLAARAEALLSDLADKYPAGDMRSEALFRLFFRAWKKKDLGASRRWLEAALLKVPHEDGWWDAGRTLYWLGRVADGENKPDEARDRYTRCAREYPLSYYALSALNRLRERAPDEEQKLIAALHTPAPSADDLRWRFGARPLFAEPGFARAVELARLGLGSEARRELAAVGVRPPEKGQAVASPEQEELLWLVAVLYDRAGEYAQSHWIPRHTLTAYSRTWPTGDNRKRWLISYPQGYAQLITENASKCGQPPSLEFAIVREESAFDPLTESFANAIGLTQLTAAPAKRFAEGLPYTREALKDPAINVPIGAREFGWGYRLFGQSAPLAIAAYNAGEGAVKRWLRELPTPGTPMLLDEFVESIPYDETRGYTKRVLASYFAYHWIYDAGDPVPTLPLELPASQKR